jgi:hypothetical protein
MGHLRLVHSLPSASALVHPCVEAFDGGDATAADCCPHLIDALLAAGRIVRPQPDVIRARALVRARATLATADAFAPAPAWRGRRRKFGLTAAVCLAFATGATGAALALQGSGWLPALVHAVPPVPASEASTNSAQHQHPHTHAPTSALAPVPALPDPGSKARRPHPRRAPAGSGSYAPELECLQRAQAAFAGRDFPRALAAAAEHARRFPNGWFAEEREALRVQSLAGAGRTGEARLAAAAFGARFPRSVLWPHVRNTSEAAE